jgi:Pectate lyase superfamily protein/Major tropism determinant N-terminal domain
MAIDIISRIQNRRGLYADLPASLAEGEIGFCLDTREMFIGNSPGYGNNTQVLTEFSQNDQLITTTYQNTNANLPSATPRTLQSKLNDFASIKDFGAKGDGTTDDAPAINTAISELLKGYPQSGNLAVTLYFPPGIYLINSPILLYPFLNIKGAGLNCSRIVAKTGTDMNFMFQTSDSLGQTGANIGLNGATLPQFIQISDLRITTNNQLISIFNLVRYRNINISNCYIIGGWTSSVPQGDDSVFYLQSIGNAFSPFGFHGYNITCINFSNAALISDPVQNTSFLFCVFNNLWRGINITNVNYGGPYRVSVTNSQFLSIIDRGIYNASDRPSVSTNNFYTSTGGIYWASSSSKNVSMGDVFDHLPGVVDDGSSNSLILNPGQSNLP